MKITKYQDEKYRRDFISMLPCLACSKMGVETFGVQCAHIRYSEGGQVSGMGLKPPHDRIVPLCPNHHTIGAQAQHVCGEKEFWGQLVGIDPIPIGKMLAHAYEKYDLPQALDVGEKIIRSVRVDRF